LKVGSVFAEVTHAGRLFPSNDNHGID